MTLQELWNILTYNAGPIGAVAALVTVAGAVLGLIFWIYRQFVSRKATDVRPDLTPIIDRLTEEARRHGAAASELEGAAQREDNLHDQVRQLTAAVEALAAERGEPDAPPGIDEALRLLSEGETEAAEAVFEEVKARRKAEGEGALKEAATAARHIGALAFLHDTGKALAAYREAVALDPDDPDGWNPLGLLLKRTGELDGAAEAYNRVLSLGNRSADQDLIAAATGNLGNLYLTRGELDRAEEMYLKSLEIDEALGRKEGMASDYGNLGILYMTRGEFDRAEEMYLKSLELDEALGRKEGKANTFSNLGNVYATRGDLDRAEEMYRKSLELFREIGAAPRIEQVEQLLVDLREDG